MIKKKFFRVLTALIAVIVMGGIYAGVSKSEEVLSIEVSAASAQYDVTSEYRSGRFYKNLTSLSLSGDGARDVVAIAMSQVGYHEGDGEGDFDGESKTGTSDFVEYNVLYGKLDNDQGNGLSYGYYWCASFANWCFRQAGIPESATGGAEVSCQRWFSDCKAEGIYRSKSGYIPVLGDIIFFKDRGSAVDSTHVGLVRYSDGNYVYTVEGNTSNGSEYSSNGEYVALKKHALSSDYIVGYAAPKYDANKTARNVDYSGGFLSCGDYIAKSEIAVFSGETLTEAASKSIPAFTVFKVTEIAEGCFKISYDSTEGYISSVSETAQITAADNVYKISYVNYDGAQMYMPQYRPEGQQKNAYGNTPTRTDSGFVGWCPSNAPDTVICPGDKLPDYDGDITLKAVWDNNVYTVLFKNSDGTDIFETSGYYGARYDIPAPPAAPEGFVFYGWNEQVDGIIRGNATYVAKFISEEELRQAGAQTEADTDTGFLFGCSSSVGAGAVMLAASLSGIMLVFTKKKRKRDN